MVMEDVPLLWMVASPVGPNPAVIVIVKSVTVTSQLWLEELEELEELTKGLELEELGL